MNKDTLITLQDEKGNKYQIIDTKQVDLQEELNKIINKQADEIERLNNILNELEKWLEKIVKEELVFEEGGLDYSTDRALGCNECLYKLRELKEEE